MARMHARRRGQSGSKRPRIPSNPKWVPVDKERIGEMVLTYATEGLSPAQVGLKLRDQHGVPNVRLATGKKLTQVMKEKGVKMSLPEDLSNLIKRVVSLQSHLRGNPRDFSNKRGLQLIESKIRRLTTYYKRKGMLPGDWDYSAKLAELQVK